MNSRELIQNPFIKDVALTAAEGLGLVAITTIYNHRELTHESVETKTALHLISEAAMFSIGQNPKMWAEVHKKHHRFSDANLAPILEMADYIEWRQANPERQHPPLPSLFANLDPGAELGLEDIRTIGDAARPLVKDSYDAPESYSLEEELRLLDTKQPRYFYPHKLGLRERLEDKAPAIIVPEARTITAITPELRDPHSPILHENGVLGIFKDNMALYKKQAAHEQKRLPKRFGMGVAPLFIGNIALQVLGANEFTPANVIRRAAVGSAVAGAIAGVLVFGGNLTNSAGHPGNNLLEAVLRNNIVPNPDGTYSYNAKWLSLPTFDEVGGQDDHHQRPGDIAYTSAHGIRKAMSAPFGSLLEAMADRDILLRHGKQFGQRDNPDPSFMRPDEPHKAVVLLQQARV
ncbi:MAG: hypothetical protein ACREHG_08870, partial [Candidatus Saccharimonadales bacterium]